MPDDVMKNLMKEFGGLAKGMGLGSAPSGTPEATWSIYVYAGKVYIPAKVRTKDGGTMTTGPIAVVDTSDATAVAAAIVAEVARNVPVVPDPDWSSPEHLNRPSVKKAAGTKNYKGFLGWGVVKHGGKFYAVRLRMEPDGANVPAITNEPPHGDAAGAAKQVAAEIAESQQPGQSKYAAAKARASPTRADSPAPAPSPPPDQSGQSGAPSSISEDWLRKNVPNYANMSPGEQRAHRALAKPDAMWFVFVYEGKVYIPSLVTTQLGGMIMTGPIAVVDAAKPVEVAAAIAAEVAKNMPAVPDPRDDWDAHMNRPSTLKAAGTKNYVGFYGWCVTRQLGEYYAQRVLMEPDGGGPLRITNETPFADGASAAKVIAAEIAESQQPGQTKYVPAKSKAKPKPAKASASARSAKPDVEPKAKPGELTIEQLAATAPKAKRPTEAQVAAFEATLPRPLPPDYRRFLLLCNGEVDFDRLEESEDNVFNSFHTINHVKHLQTLESVREVMQDPDALRISEEVLPIGDGVVGDSICIGLTGKHRGKIFFWDHENEPDPEEWDGTVKGSENTEVIAESFTALIGKMMLKRK